MALPTTEGRRTKVLALSSLYPSTALPQNGIFIEHRLRHLLASGQVDLRVVSPVPWFPSTNARFGHYARLAAIPAREERFGIPVAYPRFPTIPKFGMTLAPTLMAAALYPKLRRMLASGDFAFDVLDSYYIYPDGVAAVWLGRMLKRPVIISALGTDINLIPRYRLARRMIQWAAHHAAGITTVCQALKDGMVDLGVPAERIRVVLHGVDLDLFRPPADREALRARLGLTHPTLLSVGHLIERKGHHFAVEALAELPEMDLVLAGYGPEEAALRRLAARLGVTERVRFLGFVDQAALRDWYGAADCLVLASSREGIANVILEALACGTPVAATRVWGAPEVIDNPAAGVLIEERSGRGVASGVRHLLGLPQDRAATRRQAERFRWEHTTRDHLAVLAEALRSSAPGRNARTIDPGRPTCRP